MSNTELHTCMVELCGRYLPSVPAEGVNAPARPHVPDLAVVVKGARDDQVPFAHWYMTARTPGLMQCVYACVSVSSRPKPRCLGQRSP